jgi:LmbE family N-acetylglucosaminyl deacetylase
MNVLGIGAHYDDLELGCGGTLVKHVMNGDNVTMLVVTKSGYKGPNGNTIREDKLAFQEGLKASKIIGAKLVSLEHETLTSRILHLIEELKIETIYTHWCYDVHRDHQNIAKYSMMAGRNVSRFLMYRSNQYDTERTFNGNFYSDISDVIERKKEAIKIHESELKRVKYKWLNFFETQNANDGQKIGVKFAECFEIVRYLT